MMTRTEIIALSVGALLIAGAGFAFGKTRTATPTPAGKIAAIVPVNPLSPNTVPAALPPIVMLPPANQSQRMQESAQIVNQSANQSSAPPTDTSFYGASFAQQRAKLADMARQRDSENQQLAIDGKSPMPDYMPTFHTDASGNIYHFENGTWRMMSDQEIKNPTPQEQAESSAGLARAQADSRR